MNDKTLCELRKSKQGIFSKICTTRKCKLCSTQVVVESGKTMGCTGSDAGNKIQIPTTQNCDSTNGIYCIVCSICNKLYVGETWGAFRTRIHIHRSDVRLKKDTKDDGVTPFVITHSATAVEAANLVQTSFNKLKVKHPNILDNQCVMAYKRGQNLRDLLVRSRLRKAPLDSPTVTGSDSSQDLTTIINALGEV